MNQALRIPVDPMFSGKAQILGRTRSLVFGLSNPEAQHELHLACERGVLTPAKCSGDIGLPLLLTSEDGGKSWRIYDEFPRESKIARLIMDPCLYELSQDIAPARMHPDVSICFIS